jgi:hypothetical protein
MPAIDQVLPEYHFNELHAIPLRLPPDEAVAAALATLVACDPVVRLLFRLRGLPLDGTIGDVFKWMRFTSDGAQLSTETRIQAVDEAARRAFARYWRIVGPFSGVIRRRSLKHIAAG